MIKKIIVSICLLFSFAIFAQEGTSSPYSFYGIGDVKFKGTAENRAMGGLTIYSDSIHLNFQNPGSYSNLKLTTFSLGGTYLTTDLSTNKQRQDNHGIFESCRTKDRSGRVLSAYCAGLDKT